MRPQLLTRLVPLACLLLSTLLLNAQNYSGVKPIQDFHRHNGYDPTYTYAPVNEGDTLAWIRFRGRILGSETWYTGANIMSWITGPVTTDHFPANMVFRTNDRMRMTIRDNGNVGVNTFLPEQLFTVSHPDLPVIRFDRSNAGERDFELFNGVSGNLFFRGGANGTGAAGLTNFMVLTYQGRLGLGTDNPDQLLTISAPTLPVFRFDQSTIGEEDFEIYTASGGDLFFRGGADGTGAGLSNFMVLTHLGRLGLGTDTPDQLFTISAVNAPVFRFDQSGSSARDFELYTSTDGDLLFRGGADDTGLALDDHMVLTYDGLLGLGTLTPDQLLTLSDAANPVLRFERIGADGFDMELSLETDGNLYFRGGLDDTGTNLTNLMMLTGTGKLAVGTTQTPDVLGASDLSLYTLYAAGGILTEEVRVRTGWADHVFSPTYSLRSLEEVDSYIQENGRLPGMPSSAEVEANGLEMGDITVQQQEKIEELYLYLIEMDKELKALKRENEALKARIEQLER